MTFAVLSFFAFIQSIYGVGLLIFGTPFLILNAVTFDEALGFLLPSSFLISLHQVFLHRNVIIKETKSIVPALIGLPFGLCLVLQFEQTFKIMPLLGLAMLFAAIIRSSSRAVSTLSRILSANKVKFHFCNAFIHGVSNLGGAFLPVYSSSVYGEKIRSLKCTSTFYLIYSGAQILVLIFMEKSGVFLNGLLLLPLCLFCYWLGGKYVITELSQELFDKLAIAFFWCIGIVLLVRSFS